MSYNTSIPQPGDFISVSQEGILQNFSIIETVFSNNHVSLQDGMIVDRGKHEKVGFSEQSGDPITTGDTYAVYTKDDAGSPEVYARLENNGSVYKWTKAGRLSPGLRLEAYVIFDEKGNILKNPNDEQLSYNVTSVTQNTPNRDDWTIAFTNNISTANYFWCIGAFYGPSVLEQSVFTVTTPYMFGTYADAIKVNEFRCMTKNINGLSTASQRMTKVVQVQIFTVA